MIRFFAQLIFSFFSNFIALFLAVYFVEGFKIAPGFPNFFLVAGIFTLINIFIRPILKLIFSPIILLTFGLGIIFVNALTVYFLDIVLPHGMMAINGLKSLFYATLIISAFNILINFSAKRIYKN